MSVMRSSSSGHHNCHGGDRIGFRPFHDQYTADDAVLLDIFFAVIFGNGSDLGGGGRGTRTRRGRTGKTPFVRQRKRKRDFALPAIVESCEDAIISGTLEGIIVSWNGGAQRYYAYTEAEALESQIAILLPPELADEENRILETLRAAGRMLEHFETVRVTKTGNRISVSLTISAIRIPVAEPWAFLESLVTLLSARGH